MAGSWEHGNEFRIKTNEWNVLTSWATIKPKQNTSPTERHPCLSCCRTESKILRKSFSLQGTSFICVDAKLREVQTDIGSCSDARRQTIGNKHNVYCRQRCTSQGPRVVMHPALHILANDQQTYIGCGSHSA